MNEFDRHPSIRYNDAYSLWWDTYCIRVVIKTRTIFESKHRNELKLADYIKVSEDRKVLEMRIVPPDESHHFWRTATSKGFNYFFVSPNEALEFIDANLSEIAYVDRPVSMDAISAIRQVQSEDPALSGIKVVVRPKLFFGKYTYCIHFRSYSWRLNNAAAHEINETIIRLFHIDPITALPEDQARIRFKFPTAKRAYVRDLNDVILIKLCIDGDLIESIERAVLESEIQDRSEEIPLAA